MTIRLRNAGLLAVMMAAAAVTSPAWCGTKELDDHFNKSVAAVKAKDWQLAEQELRLAEKECPVPRDVEQNARLLMQHGRIYINSKRNGEAMPLLIQAKEALISKFGPKDGRLETVCAYLAQAYFNQEKYSQAAAEVIQGYSVMQPKSDGSPPEFMDRLGRLMTLIAGKIGSGSTDNMAMLSSAEVAINRAKLSRALQGGFLNQYMAECFYSMGKFKECESRFKSAIEIFSALKDSEQELGSRLSLAYLYQGQSRLDEAEKEYSVALTKAAQAFGPKSQQYARVLSAHAGMLMDSGKIAEARDNLKKALAIIEKDPDNPDLFPCLCALANTYLEEEKYSEAEALTRRVLADVQSSEYVPTEIRLNALDTLADALVHQNKYVEAEKVCNEALAYAQRESKESLLVAQELLPLMSLNLHQGKYKEAEQQSLQIVAIKRKLLGDDNLLVAEAILNSANVATAQRQFAVAESRYAEALRIWNLHPEDLNVSDVLKQWAQCYNEQARYSDAEARLLQAEALLEKHLGRDHLRTINVRERVANNSLDAGKYADAERRLLELLALREKVDGPNSPPVANVLSLLVRTYTEMGDGGKATPFRERMDKIKAGLPGAPPPVLARNPVIAAVPQAQIKKSDVGVANKWAVIIGISNFKDPSINLKYAAKDAQDFANFLTTEGNFNPENVKLLIDQDANRHNIADALGDGWLAKKARRNDVVVIYVSSHGGADTTNAAGVNFLCSHESNAHNLLMTGIPMEWFSQIIRDQIPSERVVVFLDVCHSGAAAGGKGMSRERNFDVTTVQPGRGQIIIASSLANQLSWESKQYENGVFTRRLIDSLRLNGNRTTLSEAFDAMRQRVENEVLDDRQERQTPVMKRTWDGDELRLAAPSEAFSAGTAASRPAQPVQPAQALPTATDIAPTAVSAPPGSVQASIGAPPASPAHGSLPAPLKPLPTKPVIPGSQDDF